MPGVANLWLLFAFIVTITVPVPVPVPMPMPMPMPVPMLVPMLVTAAAVAMVTVTAVVMRMVVVMVGVLLLLWLLLLLLVSAVVMRANSIRSFVTGVADTAELDVMLWSCNSAICSSTATTTITDVAFTSRESSRILVAAADTHHSSA